MRRILPLCMTVLGSFLVGNNAAAVEAVTGFGSNPGNLKMYQHVPANAVSPMPLVVVMHGCTQQATPYAQGTGWVDLANQLGFALVMPEQQSANNNNSCFNWFQDGDITRGMGETESIHQMITFFSSGHTVDTQRIFVTGLSAGGAMTDVMLATYPDLFAAGAIFAGIPYRCGASLTDALSCMNSGRTLTATQWGDLVRAASSHTGSWPRVSIWHGTTDHTVVVANAESEVLQWTDVNGVPSTPTSSSTLVNHTIKRFSDGANAVRVEEHLVTGMDHGTPVDPGSGSENCGTAGAYILDVNICSTREAARFFGLLDSAPIVDGGVITTPDASVPVMDASVAVHDAGTVTTTGTTETFSNLSGSNGLDLTGWTLNAFSIVTDDHTGTAGSKSIHGSITSGTPGCATGVKSTTLSRAFTLSANPRLRYQRKLALDAAVNINSAAGFKVMVGADVVDESTVSFNTLSETSWTPHVVDLTSYAGQTVNLTFQVSANSTVCIAVTATVTLDDITLEDGSAPPSDAGTVTTPDAAVTVADAAITTPDASTPAADASTTTADAGTNPSADAGATPIADAGTSGTEDAGSSSSSSKTCNCNSTTQEGSLMAWLAGALLLARIARPRRG